MVTLDSPLFKTPLACSGFTTAKLSQRQIRDTWSDAVPTHDILRTGGGDPAAPIDSASAYLLDKVIVSPCEIHGLRERRHPRLIRRDQIDHYAAVVCISGVWRGHTGNDSFIIEPGRPCIIDMGQPVELDMQWSRAVQLIVPHTALDSAAQGRNLHGFALAGPLANLFVSHLLATVEMLPQLTTLDAAPLANTLCELLAASIRPALASPAADNIAATIRQRAMAEIDARLQDPALSVEQIHRAVGVSRSRLYEALEPFGGVSAVIQERRLRAARIALQQPANIGEVARNLGFTSSSHFSAAFRRRFGCTPRDVMLSGVGVASLNALADTDGETPWVDWIRTLWD